MPVRMPGRVPGRLVVPARLLTVVLAAAGLLLVVAAPAAAHAELVATSPAADSTAPTAPSAVTLTFSEPLRGADVIVTGPDGAAAATGPATVDGAVVTLPVLLGPAGRYEVAWSASADDGHPLEGAFSFELAEAAGPPPAGPAPAEGTPTQPALDAAESTSGDDDGTPGWVLPVLATAVAAGGVLLLLRRRRG